MASWITHLMIADIVLEQCPSLHRRGFCVGSVAPDCNIENEDWTQFTPPREVTHWMSDARKTFADCDRFLNEYLLPRLDHCQPEESSFLLGYWAHLIADAEFQRYIRDEARVRASWNRILAVPELKRSAENMPSTFDSVKLLIPKEERLRDIAAIDAQYIAEHPESGFLTEILPLIDFPDYIDYLPAGSIVRKIRIMGKIPALPEQPRRFLAISKEEYAAFVSNSSHLIINAITSNHLLPG